MWYSFRWNATNVVAASLVCGQPCFKAKEKHPEEPECFSNHLLCASAGEPSIDYLTVIVLRAFAVLNILYYKVYKRSNVFAFDWAMLIIKNYRIETDTDGTKTVYSEETPFCPGCGSLLSGYDRRLRTVLCGDGSKEIYSLRRLYCSRCRCIHLEMPGFILPRKHYAAQLIADTVRGDADYCPADDSTIRRWRKNYPPVLPLVPVTIEVCCNCTDTKESDNER